MMKKPISTFINSLSIFA